MHDVRQQTVRDHPPRLSAHPPGVFVAGGQTGAPPLRLAGADDDEDLTEAHIVRGID
ncbi:hypothetical protein ACFWN1_24280 [Streptomyces sp. NPDC058459]|uniref:hypothetical protein n=1 Tax=Streptomyces sp. NPDC058459 TaxID=3346508 RepID=UPI00364BCCA4